MLRGLYLLRADPGEFLPVRNDRPEPSVVKEDAVKTCTTRWVRPALGLVIVAGLAALAEPAAAQTQSRSFTCTQAAALVQSKGAVVLATSPTLYDRYVRDRTFCVYDQDTRPEWVPTRDNPQCFIGYSCYVPYRDGGRR